MYCPECGKDLGKSKYCSNCKKHINNNTIWWGVLGFFIPVVGLILFLIWKENQPRKANSAGIGALISVVFQIISAVLIFAVFTFVWNTASSNNITNNVCQNVCSNGGYYDGDTGQCVCGSNENSYGLETY